MRVSKVLSSVLPLYFFGFVCVNFSFFCIALSLLSFALLPYYLSTRRKEGESACVTIVWPNHVEMHIHSVFREYMLRVATRYVLAGFLAWVPFSILKVTGNFSLFLFSLSFSLATVLLLLRKEEKVMLIAEKLCFPNKAVCCGLVFEISKCNEVGCHAVSLLGHAFLVTRPDKFESAFLGVEKPP